MPIMTLPFTSETGFRSMCLIQAYCRTAWQTSAIQSKNRVTAVIHESLDSFSQTSETILRSPLFEENVAQNQADGNAVKFVYKNKKHIP